MPIKKKTKSYADISNQARRIEQYYEQKQYDADRRERRAMGRVIGRPLSDKQKAAREKARADYQHANNRAKLASNIARTYLSNIRNTEQFNKDNEKVHQKGLKRQQAGRDRDNAQEAAYRAEKANNYNFEVTKGTPEYKEYVRASKAYNKAYEAEEDEQRKRNSRQYASSVYRGQSQFADAVSVRNLSQSAKSGLDG